LGQIVSALEKVMYSKLLTPVIVEFTTVEALRELLPTLETYVLVRELKPLTTPAPPRITIRPMERVMSRFQNPLLTVKVLEQFKMVALPLDPRAIEEVATWPEVVKVYIDRLMYAFQFPTVPPEGTYTSPIDITFTTTPWTKTLIGADIANQEGWTGEGITSCVIDTGASPLHEHTREMEYHTTMRDKGQFKDKNGHGQHVASTVGGRRWFDRSLNVELEGMAPETHLIGIKSLGFIAGVGFESDIIEALQLALERRADVVNMSLGAEETPDFPENDPQIVAINTLVDRGILVCIAAGNSGPDPETINTPGCAPSALTVGSYSPFTGAVSEFSSRGPVVWGDGTTEIKPDVIAPGEGIYTGCLGLLDPVGDGIENHHSILSGTSMATPHVAGLLACARQYFRSLGVELNVELVKTICATYGAPTKSNDYGWGAINWDWFKLYAEEYLA